MDFLWAAAAGQGLLQMEGASASGKNNNKILLAEYRDLSAFRISKQKGTL